MQCPFVYANGRQCTGTVFRARAYGRGRRDALLECDIRKIRLWCSEKNDHAGAVPSFDSKDRMEFYPDQLERSGLYAEAIALCDNVMPASELEDATPKPRPRHPPSPASEPGYEPPSPEDAEHPPLATFRELLEEEYGDRLDRLVLYGVTFAEDELPDYHVAVYLRGIEDAGRVEDKLLSFSTQTAEFTQAFVIPTPIDSNAPQVPPEVLAAIERQGIAI